MTSLVEPGNDYRSVFSMPDGSALEASVIIPVYNRVELLVNVLAGLSAQRTNASFEVVVVDDGSEEDIEPVVAKWAGELDLRYVRQDHNGRGAGRARNIGGNTAKNDVLVFLDADCIPGPDFIEKHLSLHRRADNLVVTGSRRHVDRPVLVDEVVNSFDSLQREATGRDRATVDRDVPDDWRRVFYRRTQRLLLGDTAYRAVLTHSMSVLRSRFHEAGAFDEAFSTWGGEDTELGWRLWNNGCFVIPMDDFQVIHQRHLDLESEATGRADSRLRILPLVADRVPNRFYRKEPSHLYTVPKVSWLITVDTVSEADRAWREASLASYVDTEIVVIGDGSAVENRASAAAAAPNLSLASTFGEAVAQARGEILAIVDGRARFDRRLLARTMKRFGDQRVSAVRVGYRTGRARIIRLRDLRTFDEESGRDGLPFFGLIRRRELMKDPIALDRPGLAWGKALDRSKTELLVTDLVEVPHAMAPTVRLSAPGIADVRAAGATEIARGIKRAVRPQRRSSGDEPVDDSRTEARIGIEYIGFTGQQNLGDDAMLESIRAMMPWANVETGVSEARVVMVGGGTLFNADRYYLNKVRRVDGPAMERTVFGTGFRGDTYWDATERYADWEPFLDSALSVGVRGPDSLAAIRTWGFDGPADVIGDPALSLVRPDGVEPVDGRVVVCPLHTKGELWGGDDLVVFDAFARTVARLKSEGRDVVMMTAHPGDDRWAIEIMRRAGHFDLDYVAGYDNLDETLRLLASADLVIGERLHAVVLAAAMGTPFVAVEYRPKVLDFARSIDSEEHVVRTDQMDRLGRVIDTALNRRCEIAGHIEEHVGALVSKQHEQVVAIAAELRSSS